MRTEFSLIGIILLGACIFAQEPTSSELAPISPAPYKATVGIKGGFALFAYYTKKKHPVQPSSTSADPETLETGPDVSDAVKPSDFSASAPGGLDTLSSGATTGSDSLLVFSLQHQDYFTAEFLNKLAFLWFDKDAKGLISPGNAYIEQSGNPGPLKKYDKESYQQFDNIGITVFGKNVYKVGDTVDVFHAERIVKFMGKTANLVRRVAKAKIIETSGNRLQAMLFKMWDIVSGGDRIDKAFPMQGKEIDTLELPEKPLRGTVFDRVEDTESPYLYQTFILDRGTRDGVMFGDLFFVYSKSSPAGQTQPSLVACAVNVGERSSTLAIEKLFLNAISTGDTATLIRHIRFK